MSIFVPNATAVVNTPWTTVATQDVTVMCWFMIPAAVTGFPHSIVPFQTSTASGLALSTNSDGQTMNYGAANQGNASSPIQFGKWYHAAESLRCLTTTNYFVKGYLNGQMLIYVNGSGTLGTITSVSLGNNTQATPANGNPLVGNIRDFRMWTRELTPVEVVQEMNSAVPYNKEGLTLYTRLDDKFATTFIDDLGNGNIWTTTGAVALQNGGPRPAWPAQRRSFIV